MKTWLITGCSRGLGKALSEAVLSAGHQLVATARKSEDLTYLHRKYGDLVRIADLDVTDEHDTNAAINLAKQSFGHLDVVVNNAGYGELGSVEETSLASFRSQIETNLFGTIVVTKAAILVFALNAADISFKSRRRADGSAHLRRPPTRLINGGGGFL